MDEWMNKFQTFTHSNKKVKNKRMFIHQFIKKGSNHADYCEDFTIISEKDDYLLFGVFDGCSSGKESHFASAFTAKIIRAVFQKLIIKAESEYEDLIKTLLFNSITELKKQKDNLLLDTDELLSTVILFLYHKTHDQGIIIIVGDGLICINGIISIIDQNNRPHYLAYYLDDINKKTEFSNWYKKEVGVYPVSMLKDVTISTDGILSFYSLPTDEKEHEEINPVDYLIKDEYLQNNKAMLGRKCKLLYKKHFLQNADDLGMIRIIAK